MLPLHSTPPSPLPHHHAHFTVETLVWGLCGDVHCHVPCHFACRQALLDQWWDQGVALGATGQDIVATMTEYTVCVCL